MKQQINEIERMQQLAGILNEASPAMPPVPGQKPKMPPVPGQKPKLPPVPGKSSSAPLDDKRREKYINQAFDVVASTATYEKYKILNSNEIKALEDILDKVMTGFQNLK